MIICGPLDGERNQSVTITRLPYEDKKQNNENLLKRNSITNTETAETLSNNLRSRSSLT